MRWRTGPKPKHFPGQRRTVKRFAFWPTEVAGLQKVWLEIYKELQEFVEIERDLGDDIHGSPSASTKVRRWRTLHKSVR